MLIYVNQLELIGKNSSETAFKTISGWLKSVTKRHFTVDNLKSGEEFKVDQAMVRSYVAVDKQPFLYSILLTHPDHTVNGRYWDTEIGIRTSDDSTTISILLETRDMSTLVKEIPSSTKPRLVNFLQKNAQLHHDTPGLKVFSFENSSVSFNALKHEIYRENRDYPLVIISNLNDSNKPLINPHKLQEQLLGLAQVIYSEEKINSRSMSSVLTPRYSAWDGAINIIYPCFGNDTCYNKLLSKAFINNENESGINVMHLILSHITHITNGFNKKQHFSPRDVRAKRQKDQRVLLKERFDKLTKDNDFQDLAEQAFDQLEEQENIIEQLKEKHEKELYDALHKNIMLQDEFDDLTMRHNILDQRFKEQKQSNNKRGKLLLAHGDEKEHYRGEISDHILDILKTHLDSVKANTRKQHLLQDVIKNNKIDGLNKAYLEKCKAIFNNYDGITPRIKSELRKMGMEIIEDGNHNHLRFIDDTRYQVTFAKTPSDKRVGSNIPRDIKSMLL
ncbi:hypothetical protein [Providencia rettgeri]|uniref:hypothetical protein n=1 Tax=Providencia rettgeri TaxID=587 RepID=UPI0015EC6201|nr:hypothetical protein [Providencia rettgeri]QLR03167.1 hypothetical protein H0913_08800 [Providencia rettgeri]